MKGKVFGQTDKCATGWPNCLQNQDSNLCLLVNSYREISANHALASLAAQSLARTLVSLVKPYDSYYEVVEPVHDLIYPSRVTTETNNQPSSTPVLCFSFLSKCPFLFLSRHFQDRVKGSGRSAVPPSIWATGQTVVAVRNDCDFDEQCSMTTPQTECRDGKCMCQGNMYPYVKDNITQCFVRGEKKIGDKCEESLDCGYDGGVCDKTKKPICQCSPELPVTNHIDKCGKVAGCYLVPILVTAKSDAIASWVVDTSCSRIGREGELTNHATEQQRSERRIFEAGLDACAGSSLVIFWDSLKGSLPQAKKKTISLASHSVPRISQIVITGYHGYSWVVLTPQTDHGPPQYVDPAMIGVLVGMALMFIIICVVLRLFSK
uniref:EB domain-containing protein n=1 Tax=Timema cristinae TaxID=61476 RepID=A0A7R9CAX7_TIMCR|nr:unnamed protein product [Timema cristinae]